MRNIENKTKKRGFHGPIHHDRVWSSSYSHPYCFHHPPTIPVIRGIFFFVISLFVYFLSFYSSALCAAQEKRGYCVCSSPPYFFTWRVDRGLDNIISSRFLFFSLSNAKSSLHRSSPESYDTELTLKLRGEPERCLRTTF